MLLCSQLLNCHAVNDSDGRSAKITRSACLLTTTKLFSFTHSLAADAGPAHQLTVNCEVSVVQFSTYICTDANMRINCYMRIANGLYMVDRAARYFVLNNWQFSQCMKMLVKQARVTISKEEC